MNRLALYVFYEPHGILRAYVRQYIEGLLQITPDVLLIANGGLTDESKDALDALGVRWMQRENRGLDFGAWKAGLERTGWDKVQALDELVLCNCSCYGPVYPFSEMFDVMSRTSCDFWGINRQPALPHRFLGPAQHRFPVREHIQSYFYVFRKTALTAPVFQRWWKELRCAESYWEEVGLHEMEFSGWLEKNGLIGATYMDFEKYRRLAPEGDAFNLCADIQLIEDRNPLVKRKLILGSSPAVIPVLNHIIHATDYPTGCIIDDLRRELPYSRLKHDKCRILSCCLGKKARAHYKVKAFKYDLLKKAALFK